MAEGGSDELQSQKNEVHILLKCPLRKGDTWYLINTRWFKQWKKYVDFDNQNTSCVESAKPGHIDNSQLFKEGTNELKEHLTDELDYVLVPTQAWHKLVQWYGLILGQEGIARKVEELGMFQKHCIVEVYLMDLKLCQNNNMEQVVSKQFSRADTINAIEKEMRTLFTITDEKEVRLWNKYMANTYEHLNKPNNTVHDAGLYQGQVILVESKNDDGSWPRQTQNTSMSFTNTSGRSVDIASPFSSTVSASSSRGYGGGGGGSSSNYWDYYSSYYDSSSTVSASSRPDHKRSQKPVETPKKQVNTEYAAAGPTVNLYKELEEITNCPLCLEPSKQPRSLPCMHVCCTSCLQQLIAKSQTQGTFMCPSCRIKVTTPRGGASGLPVAFLTNSLNAALEKMKKLQLHDRPKCSLCVDTHDTKAKVLCVECMQTLCADCVGKHNKLLVGHKLLPCENLRAEDLQAILQNRSDSCKEHGKALELYCKTCEKLACLMCSAVSHEGHTKVPIANAVEEQQRKLEQYHKKVNKKLEEFDKLSEKVADGRKISQIQAADTEKNVDDHCNKLMKNIKQYKKEANNAIKNDLVKVCTKFDTLDETVNQAKSRLRNTAKLIDTAMTHGNLSDKLETTSKAESYDALLEDLKADHAIPTLEVTYMNADLEQLNQANLIGSVQYKN